VEFRPKSFSTLGATAYLRGKERRTGARLRLDKLFNLQTMPVGKVYKRPDLAYRANLSRR